VPVTELLEELRATFIERGCQVDRHLKPGISRDELLERTRPLGLTLPDDLVEMYAWRNGQGDDAEMSGDAFLFRDNTFVDVEGSLREYPLIQEYYVPEPDVIPYGFELTEVFPFAAHMGSSYVVVCGRHTLASPDPNPVVGVYQGVDMYFHSLEAMLVTCIEWVRHPAWDDTSHLPDDVEREIWQRHNPGAFAGWGQGS
jgi:hypothetical protein